MNRRNISFDSKFEKIASYSRAVVIGDWILVSGTTGYVAGETAADDALGQTRRAIELIEQALQAGGAQLQDIVSLRTFVARRADVVPICELLGEIFRDICPTNTIVTCGFVNDEIKVEIEAMAYPDKTR